DERRRLAQYARYFQLDIRMVEEETLGDDTLRDQIERGDSDWLAAHQSIDDERPGFAEHAGYGCAGFACDPVNAERHAGVADRCPNFVERPTLIDDHEVAADGLQLGIKLGAANEVECLEAAGLGNCAERSADARVGGVLRDPVA